MFLAHHFVQIQYLIFIPRIHSIQLRRDFSIVMSGWASLHNCENSV